LVWLFIAFSTTFLNPIFYQRCLAATTDRVAVWGIYISTACWIFFDVLTTLLGLYARAALPNAPPLNAALQYALQVLPTGLKGLFLGGVLATILSTLDGFLFISQATLTYDFRLMGKQIAFVKHLAAYLLTSLITFFLAIYFKGNFELAWRMLKAVAAGCMLPPLVVGYCRPGAVSSRLFSVMSIGVLLSVLCWSIYKPFPIDAFYVSQAVAWSIVGMGLLIRWIKKG
jgi:SSS family solute:Na+ symporter